jgi:hypothetical protein
MMSASSSGVRSINMDPIMKQSWLRLIIRRFDELRAAEEREFGLCNNLGWGGRCGREMAALFAAIARAKHSIDVDGGQGE